MPGAETVDMRQDRANALRLGGKAGPAQQRIEPDQAATGQMQAFGFPGQQVGIVPVKSVGDQKNHRPLPQHAPRPVAVEGVKRLADPRAPGPVLSLLPGGAEGGVHVAGAKVSLAP